MTLNNRSFNVHTHDSLLMNVPVHNANRDKFDNSTNKKNAIIHTNNRNVYMHAQAISQCLFTKRSRTVRDQAAATMVAVTSSFSRDRDSNQFPDTRDCVSWNQ